MRFLESLAGRGVLPFLDDLAILPQHNTHAHLLCLLPGLGRCPLHGDFSRRQVGVALFIALAGINRVFAHDFTPSSISTGSPPEFVFPSTTDQLA
jgi:hypothetical protein